MSTSHPPHTHMHRCIHVSTSHVHRSHSYTLWVIILILTLNLIYNNIIHPFCFILGILAMASHSRQCSKLYSPWLKFSDGHRKIKNKSVILKRSKTGVFQRWTITLLLQSNWRKRFSHAQNTLGLGFPFHSLQSGFYMILGTPLICCKIMER